MKVKPKNATQRSPVCRARVACDRPPRSGRTQSDGSCPGGATAQILRRRREARRRAVQDANRLKKPEDQSEQPSHPDPIEELVGPARRRPSGYALRRRVRKGPYVSSPGLSHGSVIDGLAATDQANEKAPPTAVWKLAVRDADLTLESAVALPESKDKRPRFRALGRYPT